LGRTTSVGALSSALLRLRGHSVVCVVKRFVPETESNCCSAGTIVADRSLARVARRGRLRRWLGVRESGGPGVTVGRQSVVRRKLIWSPLGGPAQLASPPVEQTNLPSSFVFNSPHPTSFSASCLSSIADDCDEHSAWQWIRQIRLGAFGS
jgi:hypothetical protein